MLTVVESGGSQWVVAAIGGDLHVYAREEPETWVELPLSSDGDDVDDDAAALLEAFIEGYAVEGDEAEEGTGEDEAESEEEEGEGDEPDEDEPEEEPEQKPEEKPATRSRGRSRAKTSRK